VVALQVMRSFTDDLRATSMWSLSLAVALQAMQLSIMPDLLYAGLFDSSLFDSIRFQYNCAGLIFLAGLQLYGWSLFRRLVALNGQRDRTQTIFLLLLQCSLFLVTLLVMMPD